MLIFESHLQKLPLSMVIFVNFFIVTVAKRSHSLVTDSTLSNIQWELKQVSVFRGAFAREKSPLRVSVGYFR